MSASVHAAKGQIISLEGISGCGKTYFLQRLQSMLVDDSFVTEVSDRSGERMDTKILGVLLSSNDVFFRTGHPCTETLLLLALKACDFEQRISSAVSRGQTVWEDRSVDTIAVYQSILLNPEHESRWLEDVHRILNVASQFRPLPDLTFLIDDDFEESLSRAERRNSAAYSDLDRRLLAAAQRLYSKLAAALPDRFAVIDRRQMSEDSVLAALRSKTLQRGR